MISKDLVWEEIKSNRPGRQDEIMYYQANGLLKTKYKISPDEPRYYIEIQHIGSTKEIANKGSLDEAKAAAQAHYEEKIMSEIDANKMYALVLRIVSIFTCLKSGEKDYIKNILKDQGLDLPGGYLPSIFVLSELDLLEPKK